jgi:hypothetical protein
LLLARNFIADGQSSSRIRPGALFCIHGLTTPSLPVFPDADCIDTCRSGPRRSFAAAFWRPLFSAGILKKALDFTGKQSDIAAWIKSEDTPLSLCYVTSNSLSCSTEAREAATFADPHQRGTFLIPTADATSALRNSRSAVFYGSSRLWTLAESLWRS